MIAQPPPGGFAAGTAAPAARGPAVAPGRPAHEDREAALDREVPALLIRQDWNPAHHATLGVIRSLGRAGVPVHAMLESPRVPAARSRYLAGSLPWWPARLRQDERAQRLAALAQRIGGRPVLYAMDDASAILLAEHGGLLRPYARLPEVAPGAPLRVADKARLAQLCGEGGFDHPAVRLPENAREARAAARELGLPLVAKWTRPWLLPRGGSGGRQRPLRSTTLVGSLRELAELFGRRAEAGSALLLQELIAPSGADWFFHGYFRAVPGRPATEVECLFAATGRKELAWPRTTGLTARGRWQPQQQVAATGIAAVRAAGLAGPVDLDFRLDPDTGRCHLLDFNPRLGAQFRLFTDAAGLDLPRAAHLDLTGRPVPPLRPRAGRTLVVEFYDPFGALQPGREVERAWLDLHDPMPFAAAARRAAVRSLNRLTALGKRSR